MDNESAVWRWVAMATGVVIICFLLGYFVLGPSARSNSAANSTLAVEPPPPVIAGMRPPASGGVHRSAPVPTVDVEERTDEIEAKKRKEDEERKKRDDEERQKRRDEERKKRDDEARQKAEDAARADTADTSDENPADSSPDSTTPPDTNPTPDNTAPVSGGASAPPASVETNTGGASLLFRVRAGTFENRANAQSLASELTGRGFATRMMPIQRNGKTLYQLQVGAFAEEKRALDMQKTLKANGYDATVSKEYGTTLKEHSPLPRLYRARLSPLSGYPPGG